MQLFRTFVSFLLSASIFCGVTVCVLCADEPKGKAGEKQDAKSAKDAKDAKAAKTKPKKESPLKGKSRDFEGERFCTQEEQPVRMSATFHYGNADKETVPVLLLHGSEGSRADFEPLTELLTKNGYAVLAPDLRGHGKSTKRLEITMPTIEMKQMTQQRSGGGSRKPKVLWQPTMTAPGSSKLVDYLAEDFQPLDYMMMIRADLPLFRSMLEYFHTEGVINLNRLVVVGIGRGATLAAYVAAQDWQGKDGDKYTKTLVMIAPETIVPTQNIAKFFENNRLVRDNLVMLCAVPKNDQLMTNLANQVRETLLDKEADGDPGGMESRLPIYTYPADHEVRNDSGGESRVPLRFPETFSSRETGLAKTVFKFIEDRNKAFKEREARWTKLR